jgi:hypothetical protein
MQDAENKNQEMTVELECSMWLMVFSVQETKLSTSVLEYFQLKL